jgi:hypothetical protein
VTGVQTCALPIWLRVAETLIARGEKFRIPVLGRQWTGFLHLHGRGILFARGAKQADSKDVWTDSFHFREIGADKQARKSNHAILRANDA